MRAIRGARAPHTRKHERAQKRTPAGAAQAAQSASITSKSSQLAAQLAAQQFANCARSSARRRESAHAAPQLANCAHAAARGGACSLLRWACAPNWCANWLANCMETASERSRDRSACEQHEQPQLAAPQLANCAHAAARGGGSGACALLRWACAPNCCANWLANCVETASERSRTRERGKRAQLARS